MNTRRNPPKVASPRAGHGLASAACGRRLHEPEESDGQSEFWIYKISTPCEDASERPFFFLPFFGFSSAARVVRGGRSAAQNIRASRRHSNARPPQRARTLFASFFLVLLFFLALAFLGLLPLRLALGIETYLRRRRLDLHAGRHHLRLHHDERLAEGMRRACRAEGMPCLRLLRTAAAVVRTAAAVAAVAAVATSASFIPRTPVNADDERADADDADYVLPDSRPGCLGGGVAAPVRLVAQNIPAIITCRTQHVTHIIVIVALLHDPAAAVRRLLCPENRNRDTVVHVGSGGMTVTTPRLLILRAPRRVRNAAAGASRAYCDGARGDKAEEYQPGERHLVVVSPTSPPSASGAL